MAKTLSCESLHHAVYAAPDVLRHCCKRFFVDGKMKGDVEISDVTSDVDISYDRIREKKKKLHEDINQGKETPCTGCPWLTEREWPSWDKLDISLVSIEHHTVCNLRCTYCSDMYYGGKKPSYSIKHLFKNLSDHGALNQRLSLVWGGGEPMLFGSFDTIFSFIADKYKPVNNNVFTNAVRHSSAIEKYLRRREINITVSMDAGTSETFKLVRGRDRFTAVLENLARYHNAGGDKVIIKYILMPENSSKKEVMAFVDCIKQYGLEKCSFQISADFKDEVISDEVIAAAGLLLESLKKLGAEMINFDYHLRPRVRKALEQRTYDTASNKGAFESVIVWGAGEYALRMLEQKSLSKSIKFFVDSDPVKQGGEIDGIKIKPPSDILSEKNSLIFIASSQYYRDIYHELLDMGVSADKILDANLF